ncbi:MAG: ATP-binding protein [Flavobacteriales bacterium]|nr:ATP-binding protein [Flavobacteriales bacterium]
MIKRELEYKLRELLEKFPIVTLTGPRQTGKTTLIKAVFKQLPYISLENIDDRLLAQNDPKGFLANYPKGAILDEIQRVPDLFSYIQTIVDSNEVKFVLSGSQNFLLLENIAQSLAGRTALLKLLPFSYSELQASKRTIENYETLIYNGGYPRIYDKNIHPSDFYPNYINSYIERDVRAIKNIENLSVFTLFLKLCAGRIGQLLNLQSLAIDAGISLNTAKSWIVILEASYIIYKVQPHYKNFNKRLVKTPKLYFYDTGLACSLLGIENEGQVVSHYLKGNLFENLVMNEFLKKRTNLGKNANSFFWQTKDKKEIDLLFEKGNDFQLFEIKSSKTKHLSFFDNLLYWKKLNENQTMELNVIFGGDEDVITSNGNFISWRNIAKLE